MNPLWYFAGFFLFFLALRLVAGAFDHGRIQKYLEGIDCALIRKKWDPLGSGHWGGNMRIYKVLYRDSHGATHRASVKTSTFGGVYLSQNRVVEQSNDSVEAEKAALRKRLEELEKMS